MGPGAVILSPHFDDAVLSCWHVLASSGEVLVVNVFAGEPAAGTLGWWDRLAGATDSAAVVRMRVEEDPQALALAGRAAVNLSFLDSQYRRPDQASVEPNFVEPSTCARFGVVSLPTSRSTHRRRSDDQPRPYGHLLDHEGHLRRAH